MGYSITAVLLLFLFLQGYQSSTGYQSSSITVLNNCEDPTVTSISSHPSTLQPVPTNRFGLKPGESTTVDVPKAWSGRITGHLTTQWIEGGTAPKWSTTAEFFLFAGANGEDVFDVSVAGGYSIDMNLKPRGGRGGDGDNDNEKGNCMQTGCVVNINMLCVFDELKVTKEDGTLIGCRSPCEALSDAQPCCSGDNTTPGTCKPTLYSFLAKTLCPLARTYHHDNNYSFTCLSTNYLLTFCPHITSLMMEPEDNKNPTMKLFEYIIYALILVATTVGGISIYFRCFCCNTNN